MFLIVLLGAAAVVPGRAAKAASERVVYFFKGGGDGAYPVAGLTYVGGAFYGTTLNGGAANAGIAFSLNVTTGAEQVLDAFMGASHGSGPHAGLHDEDRTLYGTTAHRGGKGACMGAAPCLRSAAGGVCPR